MRERPFCFGPEPSVTDQRDGNLFPVSGKLFPTGNKRASGTFGQLSYFIGAGRSAKECRLGLLRASIPLFKPQNILLLAIVTGLISAWALWLLIASS